MVTVACPAFSLDFFQVVYNGTFCISFYSVTDCHNILVLVSEIVYNSPYFFRVVRNVSANHPVRKPSARSVFIKFRIQ